MNNQQAPVNEQPSTQINRSKQVPFGLLLPILIPQLPKDRAMQLQTLFNKLKRDEIPKEHFVRLMKEIVGDQMLRIALTKVQQQVQTNPNTGSSGQQHPVRMPTVNSGQNEQGSGVNQGTVKDHMIPIREEDIEVPAGEAEGECEQQVPPPEQQAKQQKPAAPEAMGHVILHQILDVFWEIRTDFGQLERTFAIRLGAVEARLKDLEEAVTQIPRDIGYESTEQRVRAGP